MKMPRRQHWMQSLTVSATLSVSLLGLSAEGWSATMQAPEITPEIAAEITSEITSEMAAQTAALPQDVSPTVVNELLAQTISSPAGSQNSPSGDLPRLVEGMEGTAVTILQVILRDLGFYDGRLDGEFGPKTAAAARSAQAAYDLVQDAVIGPVSWPILLYHWDNR